jgi:hypothetical protein
MTLEEKKRERKKFRSITVEDEVYNKLDRFAREKDSAIGAFLKKLVSQYENIATLPLLRLGVTPLEVVWPRQAWKYGEPFKGIFDDPGIETYKSIAWLKSAEYVQKAGKPQWPDELKRRIQDVEHPFIFKKMLLLSREARGTVEAWEWAFWWLQIKSQCPPDRVSVFVVDDERAKEWKKPPRWPKELADLAEYNDFGIYGDKAIGFLKIEAGSEPGTYTWRLNPKRGGNGEKKAENVEDETQMLFDKLLSSANMMFDELAKTSMSEDAIKAQLGDKLRELAH